MVVVFRTPIQPMTTVLFILNRLAGCDIGHFDVVKVDKVDVDDILRVTINIQATHIYDAMRLGVGRRRVLIILGRSCTVENRGVLFHLTRDAFTISLKALINTQIPVSGNVMLNSAMASTGQLTETNTAPVSLSVPHSAVLILHQSPRFNLSA